MSNFKNPLIGSSSYKTAVLARSFHAFITRGVIFLGVVLYLSTRGEALGNIALLTAVYFAPQLIFNVIAGSLSDALRNRRLFISAAFIGSGIIFFFYPMVGWIGYILALRFGQGILESGILPLTQALASQESDDFTRSSSVSLFKIAVFTAASLGPIATGYIIELFGFTTVFFGTGFAMITTGVIAWCFIDESDDQKEIGKVKLSLRAITVRKIKDHLVKNSIFASENNESPSPFSPSKWKKHPPSLFSFITFIRRVSFNVFMTFIPVYLVTVVSLSEGSAGLFEGIRRFMIVVAIALSAPLVEKWGRKPLLILASFSFLGPLLYVMYPTISGIWIASIVLGITIGLFNPTSITYMVDFSPAQKEGTYLGSLESTSATSRVIGPIVGGIIANFAGLSLTFIVAGTIMLTTLPLSFLLEESRPK